MASTNDVISGLEILRKYDPKNGEAHDLCAEHDVIIYGAGKVDLSDEDMRQLEKLGWHWSSEYYSWARFV